MLPLIWRSALFLMLTTVGPGMGLQRLLRLRLDVALVAPLGWAATAFAYWLSISVLPRWSFPVLMAAFSVACIWPPLDGRRAASPPLRRFALPACCVVLLLSLTAFPWNRSGPLGEFILDPLVPFDTAFHVGLAQELTIGYPPQVPGLAGFPLGYHLGADLVRAAAFDWFGLSPYHTITRLDTITGGLALILLLGSIAHRLGLGPGVVSLAAFSLLATDWSFLFASLPAAHWWTDLLRGNLLISLDRANPIVPALALVLGALLALARHLEGEGRGWLFLATVQALAVPFFKVFLGAHLLLGLAVAFLLSNGRSRKATLAVAVPLLITTLALASGTGSRTVAVTLDPLDLVRATRDTLGLEPQVGLRLLGWSVFWVAASLGLRIVGVLPALRALRSSSPLPIALAVIALSGWPLGLMFRVSAPEVLPGQKTINDAAFFIEQSGPLMWIFAAGPLMRLVCRARHRALAGIAVGLLCLPTTIHFAVQKWRWPNDAIPAGRVLAMQALERVSTPGDVVLQRPGARFPPAPVVLIGRRVPYERFTPWLTQFASRDALERRHRQVYRFFRTHDRKEALAIARVLDARFLCLYDQERIRFDPGTALVPVFLDPQARVYRIDFNR